MTSKYRKMSDTYLSIASEAYSLYKINGSKFHGFIFNVNTEEDVKLFLAEINEKHPQARHTCYAYALGKEREKYRINDDGEPSGTAGKPIYGQILSHQLTNVLIVSVRYSNGTKLGVGGLISAYKTSALETIMNAEIVEKTLNNYFEIRFEYLQMNDVMSLFKKYQINTIEQDFKLNCHIKFKIRLTDSDQFIKQLMEIENLDLTYLYFQ